MEKGLFYGFLVIGLLLVGTTGVFLGTDLVSDEPQFREAPSPPSEINESSALRYAETLEQTRLHNRLLNETSPDRIEISCNSRSVAGSSSSQYAFVRCSSTTYDDGSVSDSNPYTVMYRIHTAGSTRVERTGRRASPIQDNATSPQGFQSVPLSIYNFDKNEIRINTTATVLNSSTAVAQGEYRVSVQPEHGVVLDTVFTTPGTYRIHTQTSALTGNETWTLATDRQRLVILVGPDGVRIEETRLP